MMYVHEWRMMMPKVSAKNRINNIRDDEFPLKITSEVRGRHRGNIDSIDYTAVYVWCFAHAVTDTEAPVSRKKRLFVFWLISKRRLITAEAVVILWL